MHAVLSTCREVCAVEQLLLDYGPAFASYDWGATGGSGGVSRIQTIRRCPHGRQMSVCKDCVGRQICKHKRVRSTCK